MTGGPDPAPSDPGGQPTVLVVQHEDQCPPALIGRWLAESGCRLDVRRPYAGDRLPDAAGLASYSGLLVLGGSMGAREEDRFGWLEQVKELVREARTTHLPTLGICLGHQLIADALGGTVERNRFGQQVGLLGVTWTREARQDPLVGRMATPRRGVHWNHDVVTGLPQGATLLAATGRGEVQAVRYGLAMWGVQLHPEVDDVVVKPWADADRADHRAHGIDQEGLLRDIAAAREELDDAWRPLADGFADLVRRHAAR